MGGRGEEFDADAARVGPVLWVQLVGLEGDWKRVVWAAGGLEGVDESTREWVGDGEVTGHAPALGVRARGVKIDGVEGLVGFYGFFAWFWGAGRTGLEELGLCGWWL